MISMHRIDKLVMGAAVDKCYSRCKPSHSHFYSSRFPTVTFYFFVGDF